MTGRQLLALSPLIILAASSVLVMLCIAFARSHLVTVCLTCGALVLACVSLWWVPRPVRLTALLVADGYSLFYLLLILASCTVVGVLSYRYLSVREGNREEYYLLLLFVAFGAAVIVSSGHFASFFLGLEILSVAFYALIGYLRGSPAGLEGAVKYLILAAVSDAFLLFGIAALYARSGTMEFSVHACVLKGGIGILDLAGIAMFLTGIGFKLSLVPFHMWTPDVYQGAPAPVTALIATVSKGAVLAFLLKYALETDSLGSMASFLGAVAFASMAVGNLLALMQDNVKRILAYSSIAHFGYVLVAFLAGGELALNAVGYYLVAYFVTTLGAFGVLIALSGADRELDRLDDYRGLIWERPWQAAVFAVMLLSLAGIPLTAGFVGKLYVILGGVGSGLWVLVAGLVVASLVGIYYYLRIVAVMFGERPEPIPDYAGGSVAEHLVLAGLLALVLWLGLYPSSLIGIMERTVAGSG
ncbi:MAG: NADH-quinone oxidoreductase subunit N [Thermodesulfobacteriota bacterium]